MGKILDYAGMLDVRSWSTTHDACVVLPTIEHAIEWWPRIQEMLHATQPIIRTKTSINMSKSYTSLRLWVPYGLTPTQPMDFIHPFVFQCDYLLLFGLSRPGVVKWLR